MALQSLQPWLDGAIDRLTKALNPDQIILFGSWARGTATRRSDIDLFVVGASDLSPVERIGRVLTLLADAPYPIEAVVYTPQELDKRRDRPFIQQILAEGKILYERGKTPAGGATMAQSGDR